MPRGVQARQLFLVCLVYYVGTFDTINFVDKDKLFQEKVEEILPKQKPPDNKNYFQRNKKLLIIICLILLILYIAVNIYVKFAFSHISQQFNNLPQ